MRATTFRCFSRSTTGTRTRAWVASVDGGAGRASRGGVPPGGLRGRRCWRSRALTLWRSFFAPRINTHIADILLREVLGYNTMLVPAFTPRETMPRLAGCTAEQGFRECCDPAWGRNLDSTAPCTQASAPQKRTAPTAHINMEQWTSGVSGARGAPVVVTIRRSCVTLPPRHRSADKQSIYDEWIRGAALANDVGSVGIAGRCGRGSACARASLLAHSSFLGRAFSGRRARCRSSGSRTG